ncbi:MAG: DsrE family protein [Ginsengibacter sp.]
MIRILTLLFVCFLFKAVSAQPPANVYLSSKDSSLHAKDSTYRAMFKTDSIKIEKEFADKAKWESLEARAIYPVLKGGKYSGVIPVDNPTEIPDPKMDYKILFELVNATPDSIIKENNPGLDEIARVINLHAASGIPVKKIIPVVVVHAGALFSLMTNEAYQKKYKTDNPNLEILGDMTKMGIKFIACGQAMNFVGVTKEQLLPFVKISLTAQTVISGYQLKGYVLHSLY